MKLSSKEARDDFATSQQTAMAKHVLKAFENYSMRWLKFPLLFALRADTKRRHLFWSAVLSVLGRAIPITTFTPGMPHQLMDGRQLDLPALDKCLLEYVEAARDEEQLTTACH